MWFLGHTTNFPYYKNRNYLGYFTDHHGIKPKKKVKVAQSCPTLCDPMDYAVHGVFQARILEWVAFPFFRGSSQPRDWTQASCIAGGFFTSWTTREALMELKQKDSWKIPQYCWELENTHLDNPRSMRTPQGS